VPEVDRHNGYGGALRATARPSRHKPAPLIAHSSRAVTVVSEGAAGAPSTEEEMTDIGNNQVEIDEASADVFAAARWLGSVWNSSARAVSACENWEGRDELVVTVPFDQFPQVADLLDRLGEEAEAWPWGEEEVEDDLEGQITVAAETLALSRSVVADNSDLRRALRIE
jgi:hypothetical protein